MCQNRQRNHRVGCSSRLTFPLRKFFTPLPSRCESSLASLIQAQTISPNLHGRARKVNPRQVFVTHHCRKVMASHPATLSTISRGPMATRRKTSVLQHYMRRPNSPLVRDPADVHVLHGRMLNQDRLDLYKKHFVSQFMSRLRDFYRKQQVAQHLFWENVLPSPDDDVLLPADDLEVAV